MVAINNLYAQYSYSNYNNPNGVPILVLVHGWGESATAFNGDDTLDRLAKKGLFVVSVGLRGRNSATGSRDASAREIYDIYDVLASIRATYGEIISSDKAGIAGYSGGGGNALAAAAKFPDAFTTIVSHFGMSDYGYDGTDGWYYNNPGSYTAEIVTAVGDTPANVPEAYYARYAVTGARNFSGGKLYMYHDIADTSVPPVHSTNVKDAFDAASLTNYSYNLSQVADSIRWQHGYPADNADLITAEDSWVGDLRNRDAWTVPASGTHTVIGYIVTKRYSCWLNKNGTASLGTDAAATVAYDTATDTYTVIPLTSGIDVSITQGAKTGSATNITDPTQIVVT